MKEKRNINMNIDYNYAMWKSVEDVVALDLKNFSFFKF